MPWSKGNIPTSFKNLKGDTLDLALSIANGVLKRCIANGGTDKTCAPQAIRVALAKVKEKAMNEKRVLAEPTRLTRILENFKSGVRGIDIAIDVVHDADRGAAGWIRSLEVGPSSTKPDKQALWAYVEWTPFGEELVKGKSYRYISSEFGPFLDPETNKRFDDVLFAATLTNRPFVKGMTAVDADESGKLPDRIEILREGDYFHPAYGEMAIQADESGAIRKLYRMLVEQIGGGVDESQERDAALSLMGYTEQNRSNEVSMDDKIRELLTSRGVTLAEDADIIKALSEYLTTRDEEMAGKDAEIAALKEAPKELEDASATQKLEEANARLVADVAKLKKTLADNERNVFFAEMIHKGQMRPADKDRYMKLYDVDSAATKDLLENGPKVVDFDEHGSGAGDVMPSREDMLLSEARKLVENKKLSLDKAILEVLRAKPELAGDE